MPCVARDELECSKEDNLAKAIIGYNRSHHPPEIKERSKRILNNIVDQTAGFRVFGTGSLDYCFAADGQVDGIITPLAEPYHSAGYIIMEKAGMKVTDEQGLPAFAGFEDDCSSKS